MGLVSKLWASLGCLVYYGTKYLGVPKINPAYGNYHTVVLHTEMFEHGFGKLYRLRQFRIQGLGLRV